MTKRRSVLVTEMFSGLVFRFLDDRTSRGTLHIEARWGVSIENAVGAFFDREAETIYLPDKHLYETRGERYVVAWLWEDAEQTRVLVVTCVDKEKI